MTAEIQGRRRTIVVLFASVFLAAVFVLIPGGRPASGYVQNPSGCVMPNSSIGYYLNSVTTAYRTAFTGAESAWDSTNAWGYFHASSWGSTNIRVYDYTYGASSPIAWVAGGCNQNSVWYNSRVDLKFNQTKMDSYPPNKKKATASHELGHTYGLWHTNHFDCHTTVGHSGIMTGGAWTYDNCGWSTPQNDDVVGVNAIYAH